MRVPVPGVLGNPPPRQSWTLANGSVFAGVDRQLSRIGVALGPDELFNGVETELVRWLGARSVSEGSIIAVGWNVSGIQRSVSLDTLCYALAENKTYGDSPTSFEEWKAMAKKAAELHAKIGYEMDPVVDDAGYSALTALLAWRWLCAIVVDPHPATWRW